MIVLCFRYGTKDSDFTDQVRRMPANEYSPLATQNEDEAQDNVDVSGNAEEQNMSVGQQRSKATKKLACDYFEPHYEYVNLEAALDNESKNMKANQQSDENNLIVLIYISGNWILYVDTL